jgi:serine/threonine protein kinase
MFSNKLNRVFAAKILLCDRMRQALEAEIASLIRLTHPDIIRVYDYFYDNEAEFLILEFCPRGTLYEEIQAEPQS